MGGAWTEAEGFVLSKSRRKSRPRSSPRTVKAARRPQFVPTARRAPGEDWSLRSTVCRHQESRESSDEHEVAPCRVRARGLPHASRPRSEPEDGLHRSASRRLLTTPAFPRWSLVALDHGATRNKLGSTIVTHLADAPSIGPRTGSPPPSPPLKRVRRSAARPLIDTPDLPRWNLVAPGAGATWGVLNRLVPAPVPRALRRARRRDSRGQRRDGC